MKKIIIRVLLCATAVFTLSAFSAKNIYLSGTKRYSDEGNKIKLTLGAKTFELLSYNLNYFPTETEKNNSPYQTTNFTVGIKSSKLDQDMLDWILSDNQQPKTAEITVYDGDSGGILKTISFTGVKTNSFSENYNANNGYINQFLNLSFKYKTVHIILKH